MEIECQYTYEKVQLDKGNDDSGKYLISFWFKHNNYFYMHLKIL